MSTLAHTVSRSVLIDAAPEQVWEAITEAALSEWLAPEVELDPREGGEIVCRYEDGEERRGEVELRVEAVAVGTRLTVVETGLAGPLAPTALASSWSSCLGSLRLVLGRLVAA